MEWSPQIDRELIRQHAPVIGSDGRALGIVEKVEADFIRLSSDDPAAGGVPRWLPLTAVVAVENGSVRLAVSAAQAGAALLDPPRMAAQVGAPMMAALLSGIRPAA